MGMSHNAGSILAHRMKMRLVLCCVLLIPRQSLWAQVSPYAGVIGGIATLSADAGSQRSPQGLNLSSYGTRNGGAMNVFAGVHLRNYFSVQGNYVWNRNSLQLNAASSS